MKNITRRKHYSLSSMDDELKANTSGDEAITTSDGDEIIIGRIQSLCFVLYNYCLERYVLFFLVILSYSLLILFLICWALLNYNQ